MGLLEDAIREHLELKRSHGADPGEVAEQERDALGPIQQRAAEPAAPVAEEERPEVDEPAPHSAGAAESAPPGGVARGAPPPPVEEPYDEEPPPAAEAPRPAPPATELFDAEDEPFAPEPPP